MADPAIQQNIRPDANLNARRQAKGLLGKAAAAVNAIRRTPRARIAGMLRSRFALRVHCSLLLMWTFSAGVLTTKGLAALGMQSMMGRYTIAILVSYGAFLVGVRLWLAYVGAGAGGSTGFFGGLSRSGDGSSAFNWGDLPLPGRLGGGGSVPGFGGGGGISGGGGASASFDAAAGPLPANLYATDIAVAASPDVDVSGGGGGGLSGIGNVGLSDISGIDVGDDGCLIALAVMIVAIVLGVVIGSALFVITLGPEILIDAAFSAMLSSGLARAGRRATDPDWVGSVFKDTWKPLLLALVTAWVFTGAVAILLPHAHHFSDVMKVCGPIIMGWF